MRWFDSDFDYVQEMIEPGTEGGKGCVQYTLFWERCCLLPAS